MDIKADKSKIQHRTDAQRDRIYAECQEIAKRGFKWKGFMIDKSLLESKALEAVLKRLGMEEDVYIRLCQFHVIQAILNWHKDKENDHGIGFTLSHELKFEMCSFSDAPALPYLGCRAEYKEHILRGAGAAALRHSRARLRRRFSGQRHSAQTQAQKENKPRTVFPRSLHFPWSLH
ncbi:hypothetical protein B0H14DRAFT_2925400, partial [Mycena olivaceomarginata]